MKRVYSIGAAALIALAGQAFGQVQHGSVDVVENDIGNTVGSVTMSRVGGDGPWSVITTDPAFPTVTSSRGDFYMNFG